MSTNAIRSQTFLGNLPLFRELEPAELERMAEATRQLRVARGEILFHRGEPATGFYVVVYGQIKLAFVAPSGSEKVVDIVTPGQSFGEAVMFMEQPHVVTAQALADSLLLLVSKEAVFQEVERHPRFARHMLGGLSRRMRQLVADLEDYSMRSGTERFIGFLLSSRPDAPADATELEVTLPTTKGVIASRLNLTQEHFSRILHDLSAQGLIEVRGRVVHVRDVRKLRSVQW